MSCLLCVSACLLFPLSRAVAAPVVIENVPSINWGSGMSSHYEAALYATLSALGCPASYDELLVASGSAFRTAWWPGHYQYASRTMAPDDLIEIGAQALGGKATRTRFKSLDEAWAAVCESIDQGRPVILSKYSAAHVICGYDPETKEMHLQPYDSTQPGLQVLPFETYGGLNLSPAHELILVEYQPAGMPELDWPAILTTAVRYADWPAERTLPGGYVFGLGAYDAWADTLRKGLDPHEPKLSADFTVTYAITLADARSSASVVLNDSATLHEAFREAAVHYMNEAELLSTMRAVLSAGAPGTWQEVGEVIRQRFPEQPIREAGAQLIEQAKAEEMLAVEALREALHDLAPDADTSPRPALTGKRPGPIPGAEPQPAKTADADYQRGLELRRAGKLTEATEALRAAIAADPKHVEAHWVLAWVLIDLKDREGAAEQFRKVIELAPGTERATEAEKALERLKQ